MSKWILGKKKKKTTKLKDHMRRMFQKYHSFRDTEEKIGFRLNFMFSMIRKTKYSEQDLSEVRG